MRGDNELSVILRAFVSSRVGCHFEPPGFVRRKGNVRGFTGLERPTVYVKVGDGELVQVMSLVYDVKVQRLVCYGADVAGLHTVI